MRKSIKLAPGVRLNVSKRGVGMSAGAGGVRYSVNSSGRRTRTVRSGVPGVYYQSSSSGHGRSRASSVTTARSVPSQPPADKSSMVKPGLFAAKGEKLLFKAWNTKDAALAQQAGEEHPDFRLPAFTLAGLLFASIDGDRAQRLLEQAFAAGDASTTTFFGKYIDGIAVQLKVAEGVTATVPLGRDAVGVMLGELYQSDDKLDQAIDVVEQLEPTTYTAVSLAELYAQASRFQDVIELTEGISNEDDATALLLVFRGVAFREQGYNDAAHEALKEALKSRSRDATIRHHALFERARNFDLQGKKSMARKDLERILAEDSEYPEVKQRIAALDVPADRSDI